MKVLQLFLFNVHFAECYGYIIYNVLKSKKNFFPGYKNLL